MYYMSGYNVKTYFKISTMASIFIIYNMLNMFKETLIVKNAWICLAWYLNKFITMSMPSIWGKSLKGHGVLSYKNDTLSKKIKNNMFFACDENFL